MKFFILLTLILNTSAFNIINSAKTYNKIINNNLVNKKLLYRNLIIPEKKLIKASISNIAVHGITDLYYAEPDILLKKYFLSYTIIKRLNAKYRFYLLFVSSIFHISGDIGVINSTLLHILWIIKPSLCLIYLSCVHVPLHYLNAFNNNTPIKFIVFLNALSLLITFLPINKIKQIYNMWWVWIVLGHIMVVK
tara:strand:+ start:64 stop:642 length:579 start_codon:yes stop_codon:yes gene_type:complete